MLLFVIFSVFLTSSVFGRLDLEPAEPDPSPATGHCTGPNCNEGKPDVNDDPIGAANFTCNDTETSFHPDSSDCHNYFICYKGNATHQTCPADMAYRRDVKLCVAERFVRECHEKVDCNRNGVVPDSKNCTRYYNCFYGYPYHFTCPNGTRFDPVSRQCSSTVPCITERYLGNAASGLGKSGSPQSTVPVAGPSISVIVYKLPKSINAQRDDNREKS